MTEQDHAKAVQLGLTPGSSNPLGNLAPTPNIPPIYPGMTSSWCQERFTTMAYHAILMCMLLLLCGLHICMMSAIVATSA